MRLIVSSTAGSAAWTSSRRRPQVQRALPHPELRAHCRELIAGYKCPRSVEFVAALPISAAGKILKRELRAPHWEAQGRSVS